MEARVSQQTAYLVPLRPKGRNSRLFLTEADFGSLCSPDTYFTRPVVFNDNSKTFGSGLVK